MGESHAVTVGWARTWEEAVGYVGGRRVAGQVGAPLLLEIWTYWGWGGGEGGLQVEICRNHSCLE